MAANSKERVLVLNIGLEADKYLASPLIDPLYVHMIGYFVKAEVRDIIRAHGSDNYIIMYCFDGKGWFQQAGKRRMTVTKNTAVLIRPGVPYSYGADPGDPWGFYFVHIRGKHTDYFFENHSAIEFVNLDESFLKCKQLFSECCDVLKMGVTLQNMIYSSQLLGQLLTLLFIYGGHPPSSSKEDSPVRAVVQYMLDHIEERINLQQLCEMTHLSKPYLVKLFRKNTGYSPIDYFLRLKIQQSCEYICTTELSIKEVCFKFGFSDPYYFSRMFSKIMGQSPTKYRSHPKD